MLPRLLFVHVPKTGGVALFRALQAAYGSEPSMWLTSGDGQVFQVDQAELARARLVSGHDYLPSFLACGLGDAVKVSVVRDPADRMISVYNYCRSVPTHPKHAAFMALSPDDWVRKIEQGDVVLNEQILVLSGETSIRAAKPWLDRFDLLAPYPQLARAAELISAKIGAPLILNRENVTDPEGVLAFTSEQESRIAAALPDEYELLAYVQERWERAGFVAG